MFAQTVLGEAFAQVVVVRQVERLILPRAGEHGLDLFALIRYGASSSLHGLRLAHPSA
ncbi:hypothetical protein [Aquamicrobium sp.]|uniref:hypothetical protein n=1 Tax=Aquamicrobium sp. TaxID=1872579 RepID=UPI002584E335|nr:hypothetical protein [Aquamicrobium sp.]MCK9553172.1 hypothetical protein [Aquamicrobium sp.]